MRETGAAGNAPAIIITSNDVEKYLSKAGAAGAVAVFQKPVDIPALLDTIRECLEQQEQPSSWPLPASGVPPSGTPTSVGSTGNRRTKPVFESGLCCR